MTTDFINEEAIAETLFNIKQVNLVERKGFTHVVVEQDLIERTFKFTAIELETKESIRMYKQIIDFSNKCNIFSTVFQTLFTIEEYKEFVYFASNVNYRN